MFFFALAIVFFLAISCGVARAFSAYRAEWREREAGWQQKEGELQAHIARLTERLISPVFSGTPALPGVVVEPQKVLKLLDPEVEQPDFSSWLREDEILEEIEEARPDLKGLTADELRKARPDVWGKYEARYNDNRSPLLAA